MTNQIEKLDRDRRKYLKGYLVGASIFLMAWIINFIFKMPKFELQHLRTYTLIILLASLPIQLYYVHQLNSIKTKMKNDPELRSALNNELVQLHAIKAWKAAFISTIGCVSLLAILSSFFPIDDLKFVAITTILVGSSVYHLAFLIMERG